MTNSAPSVLNHPSIKAAMARASADLIALFTGVQSSKGVGKIEECGDSYKLHISFYDGSSKTLQRTRLRDLKREAQKQGVLL